MKIGRGEGKTNMILEDWSKCEHTIIVADTVFELEKRVFEFGEHVNMVYVDYKDLDDHWIANILYIN